MTNQGFNFYGGNPSNRDNVRDLVQFKKNALPSRTNPSIFITAAPELLDRSNKTSLVFRALK